MDEFEMCWKEYPRKIAKGDARKAWKQTEKIRPPTVQIISAINSAKRCEQWERDDGRFIPYFSTWLRRECWADEHEVNLEGAKEWYETSTGIEAKGRELGITPDTFANWPAFKDAVMRASRVQPIKVAA